MPEEVLKLCLSFLCYIAVNKLADDLLDPVIRRLINNPRPDHVIDGTPTDSMLALCPLLMERSSAVDLSGFPLDGVTICPHRNTRAVYAPNSEPELKKFPGVVTASSLLGQMEFKSDIWGKLKRIGFGGRAIPEGVVFSDCTDVRYAADAQKKRTLDRSQFPSLQRAIVSVSRINPVVSVPSSVHKTLVFHDTAPPQKIDKSVSRVDFCSEVPNNLEAPSVKTITIGVNYHFQAMSLRFLPSDLDTLYIRNCHPDQVNDLIRRAVRRTKSLKTLVVTVSRSYCDGSRGIQPIPIEDIAELSSSLKRLYFSFPYDRVELGSRLPNTLLLEADPEDRWWLAPRRYSGPMPRRRLITALPKKI